MPTFAEMCGNKKKKDTIIGGDLMQSGNSREIGDFGYAEVIDTKRDREREVSNAPMRRGLKR